MPKLSLLRSLARATVVVVLASCADNKGVTVLGSPGATSPAGGAADTGGAGASAGPGTAGASAAAGSANAGGAAGPAGVGGAAVSAGGDAATSGHGGTGGSPVGTAGAATGSAGGGAGGAHGGATTTGDPGQGGTGGGAAGSAAGGGAAGSAAGGGAAGSAAGGGAAGSAAGGGASGTGGGATTASECTSSSDCLPTQHCNTPVLATRKISCGPSGAGAATLGEGCLGNDSCVGGLCDVFAKTCSVGCKSESDCGAGNACIASYILGSSPRGRRTSVSVPARGTRTAPWTWTASMCAPSRPMWSPTRSRSPVARPRSRPRRA